MTPRFVIGLSFSLLLSLVILSNHSVAAEPEKRTLHVTGSGEVHQTPDAAELYAAISAVARSAKDAMAEVSQKGHAMLKAAEKHGIEKRDIQTGSISLVPVYERRRRSEPAMEPKITGYRANLRYRIASRKIKTFGTLLDVLVEAGANNVSGVRFFVTEHTKIANEARRRAIADARRSAAVLATAAGVKLGPAIRIEDNGGVSVPQPVARSMSLRSASMPIAPGQVSARAQVRVVFSLLD